MSVCFKWGMTMMLLRLAINVVHAAHRSFSQFLDLLVHSLSVLLVGRQQFLVWLVKTFRLRCASLTSFLRTEQLFKFEQLLVADLSSEHDVHSMMHQWCDYEANCMIKLIYLRLQCCCDCLLVIFYWAYVSGYMTFMSSDYVHVYVHTH